MKKVLLILLLTISFQLSAQEQSADELAKKLQNPIASLISVPIQPNFDLALAVQMGIA